MKPLFQCKLSLALLLAIAPISQIAFAQSAKAATAKSPSWIRVQASADKAQYNVGEPIKVTLKATNIQSRDAYLKYSSGQRFELELFKIENQNFTSALRAPIEPVYTWSADKNFAMMTSHIKLKSGQSEIYQGEIGSEMGELKPGRYRLEAQLSNSSQISAPSVSFVIAGVKAPKATLSATTDKSVYSVGETVKVNFSIQNNASAPVSFDFNSGQTYDVYVRDAAGEMVWSWAANKRFIMSIRQVELKADEKQDFSVEWDGRALPGREIEPGNYTIEAVYTANPAVKAAPVAIEIR